MEFGLMGLTVAGMALAVGAAWSMYARPSPLPARAAAAAGPLYTGSLNKWFVDELYARVLLNPLVLGSRQILWAIVDAQVIDGAVNGLASAVTRLARLHSRVVSGRVQSYAVGMALGAALLVVAYAVG
jgi:NADH-quinone oxidoreductase subunit L